MVKLLHMPKGIPKNGINKGWFKKNRMPHNRKSDKSCSYCGKLYHPVGTKSKFCSRSCAAKGTPNSGRFKKGNKPWSFGKHINLRGKLSEKSKQKIKDKLTGRKRLELTGKNNPNWKGGKSRGYRKGYKNDYKYKKWRESVFIRDNYTCQECGKRGCYIEPHHIKGWIGYSKLRYNLNNGVTLCKECHSLTDNYKGKANRK